MEKSVKKHIVLDLDQTLIAAESCKDFEDFSNDIKGRKDKFKYYNMEKDFIVFERPHLQEFLDYVFENFIVSVWTAASKNYALFIIDNILLKDKGVDKSSLRTINFIYFSYHCSISKKKYITVNTSGKKKKDSKNLKLLSEWFKIQDEELYKDTFILDDYNEVYNTQPNNCIIAVPFEFQKDGSHKEDFLLRVKEQLKQFIDKKTTIYDINKKIIEDYALITHTLSI